MAHPKAGRPGQGRPVKYFAAILFPDGCDPEAAAIPALEAIFGAADYRSGHYPFDMTDYYEAEMGPRISRMIVSFEPLREAPDLVRFKHAAAEVEEKLAGGGNRTVNIDPGYIDYFKAVLASFKEGPQKIYLGEGVYADPVLMYQDGRWDVLPWSFPDFREGLYMDDFMQIRRLYKAARRLGE